MNDETKKVLWEAGIKTTIQAVYGTIPKADVDRFHVKALIDKKQKDKVFAEYEKQRAIFKDSFFETGKAGKNRIDNHKIVSALMCALLHNRCIEYDLDKSLPKQIYLANYYVSFLAGVRCLFLLRIGTDAYLKRNAWAEMLMEQKNFRFPTTSKGHDPYVLGRVKALALSDANQAPFDLLGYADMLFWIEKFNMDHIEQSVQFKANQVFV